MMLSFSDQRELAIRSIKLGKIDEEYIRICNPLISSKGVKRTISETVPQSKILFMALLTNSLHLDSNQKTVCSNMISRLTESSTQYAYNTIYELILTE